MDLAWTDRAQIDLGDIVAYISEDNPEAAQRVKARLEEAVLHLATQPGMGRPGRVNGTREFVVAGTPYIIPYRVRGATVELLAVMHGARRWPNTFGP